MIKKSIKHQLLFFFLFLLGYSSFAQDFVYDWVRSAGGERWDLATDIIVDSEKNVYMTGGFEQTARFGDLLINSRGGRDIFLAKYDSLGNLQWVKTAGGVLYDSPLSIAIDSDDNILLTGNFQDTCYFETGSIVSEAFTNSFLAKYGSEGNLLNLIAINIDTRTKKLFVKSNKDGDIRLSGSFFGSMTISGDTLISEGVSDIFMASLDENLELNDLRQIGISENEQTEISLKDIAYINNQVYLACEFSGGILLNNTARKSFGGTDVLLLHTDSIGNVINYKPVSGFADDVAKSLIIDSDTSLYLALDFSSTIFTDSTSYTSFGGKDILLVKTDQAFNTEWIEHIGSKTNEYSDNLLTNTLNDLYVSGLFSDTLHIGNRTLVTENLTSDMFTAKYSPEGNMIGLKQAGGRGYDYGNKLINDKDNYLYIIGNFAYDFAFEIDSISSDSIFNANNEDIFIARFYDCDYAMIPDIGPDTSFCGYGTLEVLNPVPAESIFGRFKHYTWSNGQTGKSIDVYDSDHYFVKTIDTHKCPIMSDSIYVTIFPGAEPDLGDDIYAEPEEIVTLYGGDFENYEWSNDSVSRTITINTANLQDISSEYTLKVTNEFGCSGEDEIIIYVDQAGMFTDHTEENNDDLFDGDLNKILDHKMIKSLKGIENKELIYAKALIYPNPSKGDVYINIDKIDEDIQQVTAYTLEGKKVFENASFDDSNIMISLSSRGSHYILIETLHFIFIEKVIIQ